MSVARTPAREPLLVDTNVVSFLAKNHSLAVLYRPLLRDHDAAISFMTVAELYEGAYRAKWGVKQFRNLFRTLESFAVIESSPAICQRWGEVRALRKKRPISPDDAWIAATALVCACPLVTHNPVDFGNIPGLKIQTVAEH